MAQRGRRGAAVAIAVAVGLALIMAGSACGDDREAEAETGRRSVPRSLSRAESAAEDSIDLILAGKRDKTIRAAATLDRLAHGDLEADLEGVATKEELGDLQARAAELGRMAESGEPVAVALAANHAFELIARFFGRFSSDVPGAVMLLDHLDFEAKLRSLARDVDRVRASVGELSKTWTELSKSIPAGARAAESRSRFDAHVAAMTALAGAGTDFDGMVREAEHGLDLVDELEGVFTG